MSEQHTNDSVVLPNTTENGGVVEVTDTNPCGLDHEKNDGKIRVKFNKEIRELSTEEASVLAQKGLKFDTVSGELERLRALAKSSGKNITDFITEIENQQRNAHKNALMESCSGNSELVDRIIELEGGMATEEIMGLDELMREFPEIKSASDVPESVLEQVEIKGGNLFDAYLRYLHQQTRQAIRHLEERKKTEQSSVGSQTGSGITAADTNEEFIKGLWN